MNKDLHHYRKSYEKGELIEENDLNNEVKRQKEYPDSYKYNQFYDGFDEKHTMFGPHLENLKYNS